MQNIDARTLTKSRRIKILEKYDYVCVYCWGLADQVDHVMPWSYKHCNDEDNLVAACWLCNLIGTNKVFDCFRKKQDHIQANRYRWIKNHPIPLWLKEEIKELGYNLQKKVENSCIVFETEEERQRTKKILLKEGFRTQT